MKIRETITFGKAFCVLLSFCHMHVVIIVVGPARDSQFGYDNLLFVFSSWTNELAKEE